MIKLVVVFCLLGLAVASPLLDLEEVEELVELEAWEVKSQSIIVDKFVTIKF